MGERAKVILNEYSARDLLKRDTLDLDKFYTADLKLFVEVARKEIERLNNIIKEQGLEDKPNYYVNGLEGSLKEYQEEVKRLNNIIKSARDLFYEKCRISQNGVYTFNQVDYEELDNVLKGSE